MRSAEEQLGVAESCFLAREPELFPLFNSMGFTPAEAVSVLLALKESPDC